jgi:hypothetical protein
MRGWRLRPGGGYTILTVRQRDDAGPSSIVASEQENARVRTVVLVAGLIGIAPWTGAIVLQAVPPGCDDLEEPPAGTEKAVPETVEATTGDQDMDEATAEAGSAAINSLEVAGSGSGRGNGAAI